MMPAFAASAAASLVARGGIGHLTNSVMSTTDTLKNFNFQFAPIAWGQGRGEFERTPEHLDGIAIGKPSRCDFRGKRRATRGSHIITSCFEVQREFRGRLWFTARTERHQPLTQAQVKFSSIQAEKTTIDRLPVQSMAEFVMSRGNPVWGRVNSNGADELLPIRELIAQFFDGDRRGVQHGSRGPDREVFAGDAAALEDALLFRTELLELDLQHLLQRLRDAGVATFERRSQSPFSPILRNQALVHHVLQNSHHEKRIPPELW